MASIDATIPVAAAEGCSVSKTPTHSVTTSPSRKN
jgi:hypothetical protein